MVTRGSCRPGRPSTSGKLTGSTIGFPRRHALIAVIDADTRFIPRRSGGWSGGSPSRRGSGPSPARPMSPTAVGAARAPDRSSLFDRRPHPPHMGARSAASASSLVSSGCSAVRRFCEVGGYDGRMATEDIDLSDRLLIAGWQDGVRAPRPARHGSPDQRCALDTATLMARGQGEVLNTHCARNRSMAQPADVAAGSRSLGLIRLGHRDVGACRRCGAVINEIAVRTVRNPPVSASAGASPSRSSPRFQLFVRRRRSSTNPISAGSGAFLLGPLFPIGYWMISGLAALRSELPALFRGPADERVAWDLPRERAPGPRSAQGIDSRHVRCDQHRGSAERGNPGREPGHRARRSRPFPS